MVQRKKIIAALIIITFFIGFFQTFFYMPPVRAATTYYVSTTGSDVTGTGSFGNPWKTLSKAVNSSISGDTIYMRGGTYIPGSTTFIKNFAGPAWLTISSYPGERATIDGIYSNYFDRSLNASIMLRNSDYVRITSITVNHSRCGGISLISTPGTCDHNRIDNCTISNSTSFAIRASIGNSYLYIENNYIYNNFCNWSSISGLSQEIISNSGTSHLYIFGNYLWKNHVEQIDLKSGCSFTYIYDNVINNSASSVYRNDYYCGGIGIYLDARGNQNNVSIYRNLIYGNNTGIQINNEGATGYNRDISVFNNVINITNTTGGKPQAVGRVGILVCRDGGSTSLNKNINIYMNTVDLGPGNKYPCLQVGSVAKPMLKNYLQGLNISNNIFTNCNKTDTGWWEYLNTAHIQIEGLNSTDGATYIKFNNNLYNNSFVGTCAPRISWDDAAYTKTSPTKWGNSPLFVPPEYISPNPPCDFRLNSTSPAIDTATSSITSSLDFDGNSRPQYSGYDRGAFEYSPGILADYVTRTLYINGPTTYTVYDVWNLPPVNSNNSILCNYGSGTWWLNFTLVIQQNATLLINPDDGIVGCNWLKLNSSNSSGLGDCHIDVLGGRLFCNGTNISSWDTDHEDTDWSHFRPYIYIAPTYLNDSHAEFNGCYLRSLGYNGALDDYWGVTYEEINVGPDTKDPTGVVNSTEIQNNYIGLHLEGISDFWIHDVDIHMYNITGLYLCVSEYTALGCDNITVNLSYGAANYFYDGQNALSDGIRTSYAVDSEFQNICSYDNLANGFHAVYSDNLTISNSDFYSNENGTWFQDTDNCTITSLTEAYLNGFAGFYVGFSSNDNLFSYLNSHNNLRADFFIDSTAYNNNYLGCHGYNSHNAFEILGSSNNFILCTAVNESYDGFMLSDAATLNYIAYSNVSYCFFGGAGVDILDDANNNTIELSEFYNNTWGIWIDPGLPNGVKNNVFNEIFCNHSTFGVLIDDAVGPNYLNYTRAFYNSFAGIAIDGPTNVSFVGLTSFFTSGDNPDLLIADGANVSGTTAYLMGHNQTVNTIYSLPESNTLVHWVGMGDWNLSSCGIICSLDDPNSGVANVTHYWNNIPTYVRWEVNATAGTLTQHIGGLSEGYNYQLFIDGAIVDNVTAESLYIAHFGTTGALWFNYTGPWSNHVFELVRGNYTGASPSVSPGGGGGPTAQLCSLSIHLLSENADVKVYRDSSLSYARSNMKEGRWFNITGMQPGTYRIHAVGVSSGNIAEQFIVLGSGDKKEVIVDMNISGVPGFEFLFVLAAIFVAFFLMGRR